MSEKYCIVYNEKVLCRGLLKDHGENIRIEEYHTKEIKLYDPSEVILCTSNKTWFHKCYDFIENARSNKIFLEKDIEKIYSSFTPATTYYRLSGLRSLGVTDLDDINDLSFEQLKDIILRMIDKKLLQQHKYIEKDRDLERPEKDMLKKIVVDAKNTYLTFVEKTNSRRELLEHLPSCFHDEIYYIDKIIGAFD